MTYGCDELIRPVRAVGSLTQVHASRTDTSGTNAASDNAPLQASYAYDDFGRKLKDKDGVGREWAYTYSTAGDVLTMTDPRAKVTTQTWNLDGTLKTRSNEVGSVTYTRDVLGLATKVVNTNPAYTQDFTYNGQRRLESVRDSRGGKTLHYEYSPAGQLNAMRDSEGAETNYLYDGAGRLSGLWAANYDYLTFAYDKGGRPGGGYRSGAADWHLSVIDSPHGKLGRAVQAARGEVHKNGDHDERYQGNGQHRASCFVSDPACAHPQPRE